MLKNEKYPQIVLGTDNVYRVLVSPGVEVNFDSEEAIEEFCKNNDFTIKGENIHPKDDRKNASKDRLMHDLKHLQ